jgi:hypothetical protein
MTKPVLYALGRTVKYRLSSGPSLLSDSGSNEDYHRISLVRNFARMLALNFPSHEVKITELLSDWDQPHYKSSSQATSLVDNLLDLTINGKILRSSF